MKYPDITLGQTEAVVNKLGGMEGLQRFLAGETIVSEPQREVVKPAPLIAPAFTYASIDVGAFIEDWTKYWLDRWERRENFASLVIPPTRPDFGWGVVMPQGVVNFEAHFQGAKKNYTTWKYWGDSLDLAIPTNDRTAEKSAYAFWCRASQEAGEYPGKSAKWARDQRLRTMTALERFIIGDWFHWKTGDHLDRKTLTICAGSTGTGGGVPGVHYDETDQDVLVGYVHLGESGPDWSVREVVTADAQAAA